MAKQTCKKKVVLQKKRIMPQTKKIVIISASLLVLATIIVVFATNKRIKKLASKINPPNAVPNPTKSIVKESGLLNATTDKVKEIFGADDNSHPSLTIDAEGNRYTPNGELVINYDENTGSYQLQDAIWYNPEGKPFKYYSQNWQAYLGDDDNWYTFTGIQLPYFNAQSGVYLWVDHQYYTYKGELISNYNIDDGSYIKASEPNNFYDINNELITT